MFRARGVVLAEGESAHRTTADRLMVPVASIVLRFAARGRRSRDARSSTAACAVGVTNATASRLGLCDDLTVDPRL